ncbi:MAG: TonB-dependent receptor plug domain-containing protein [bacterium]|nr:TonB-dependent receptor plug domain-containing protein [bacterium]
MVKLNTVSKLLILLLCVNTSLLFSRENEPENNNNENLDNLFKISIQELLEVKITTPGKREQKSGDVPYSVYVITSKEINEMGYSTIIEALNTVPGFNVLVDYRWNPTVVRGFYSGFNERLLFLVDGQATTSKSDNSTIYGYAAPIDIRNVERIEIIRGPGSAIYGSGAFLGVVNVISKSPGTEELVVQAGSSIMRPVSENAIGPSGGFVSIAKNIGDLMLRVSGSGVYSGGHDIGLHFPSGAPPGYTQSDGTADGYNTLRDVKGSMQLSYDTLSIHVYHSRTKIGWAASTYWVDFNNHENYGNHITTLVQGKYKHSFSDKLFLSNRSYGNFYEQTWHGLYNGVLWTGPGGAEAVYGGKNYGSELELRFIPIKDLSLGNCFEFTYNHNIRSVQIERSFYNFSFYSVVDYTVTKWLLTHAGIRIEKFSYEDEPVFIPRASILLKPFDETVFKIIYGRAFLAPSIWELDVADKVSAYTGSAISLKPEINDSFETVFDWIISDFISSSLSLFYMSIKDARDIYDSGSSDGSGSYAYNSANVRTSKGIEWQGRVIFPLDISLWLGISYSMATEKDANTGVNSNLYGLSEVLGYVKVRVPLYKKMTWSFAGKYVSPSNNQAKERIDAAYLIDTSFLWPHMLVKGLGLRLKINNIFDIKNYSPPVKDLAGVVDKVPHPGRNISLSLMYEHTL